MFRIIPKAIVEFVPAQKETGKMPRPEVVKGPFFFDGKTAYRLRCPGCGVVAIADDDQFHGRVSIQCECGYHETHDLSKPAD